MLWSLVDKRFRCAISLSGLAFISLMGDCLQQMASDLPTLLSVFMGKSFVVEDFLYTLSYLYLCAYMFVDIELFDTMQALRYSQLPFCLLLTVLFVYCTTLFLNQQYPLLNQFILAAVRRPEQVFWTLGFLHFPHHFHCTQHSI